jgi:uncharacterized protein
MPNSAHELVTRFFAELGRGSLSDEILTEDLSVWTLSTKAETPGATYRFGAKTLVSLFSAGLAYTVHAITAEEDRATAEVTAQGTLHNGEEYRNHYVFTFRIRDGKIAHVCEYFDPRPIDAQIMPLLMAAMGGKAE